MIPASGQSGARSQNFIDLDLAVGKSQGALAASVNHDWLLGKNRKIIIGVGGRFTAYVAKNQYYATAPAQLTSGSTGPGVIFKETIAANIDTFLVAKPAVFAFNALINLGHHHSC